jgi:FO synthase
MNETITRAAGSGHGQEWSVQGIEAQITALGREPWQRTTLYAAAPEERRLAGWEPVALAEPINTPARKYERSDGEKTLVKNQVKQ